VIATVTLSRAGKSERCVASLSLKAADGKPIAAAATAKVQWTGEAAVQQIQSSAKAPGRLFTTSSTPSVPTKSCEVQVTELTVGGELQPGAVDTVCGPGGSAVLLLLPGCSMLSAQGSLLSCMHLI
jgi:hypothetical protein